MSSSRTRLSKKACIWCCEARLGALGHRERQRARGRELEPFIADQQHRLRQVERGKARIDREGDDAVGERDLLVLQAVALAAEQDAGLAAACDMRRRSRARPLPAPTTGLAWSWARAVVANSSVQVGDRLLDGVEQLDAVQNMVGAGGGALRGDVRPAVARIDDAQPRQREIAHRARGHADVLAELRLDQNDDGAGEVASRIWSYRCRPDISLHFLIQA